MNDTVNSILAVFKGKTAKRIYSLIPTVLSVIYVLAAFAAVIYYTVFPAEGYLHSDCTDTIFWAQASVDGGTVFNPDFTYAAMLPFSSAVWLIPLIKIFGVTMGVHVAGMVIFACVFFASIIFLFRSIKWSWSMTLSSCATLMLIMSSSDKLREIMWGHVIYYSLGILILSLSLGLLLRMIESFESGKDKKGCIYSVLLFVLTALGATNGFQCIALYTLPLIVGLAAQIIFDPREKIFSEKNKTYVFSLILLAAATVLGYAILILLKGGITAGYATAYSALENVERWTDQLLLFPKSYFTLVGINVEADGMVKALIKTAASFIILVLPVLLLCVYRKIRNMSTKLVLWAHITVSAVIMFGFICGKLSAANWRLTPMLGTAVIASAAAVREFWDMKEDKLVWKRLGALLAVFPILCSLVTFKTITEMPRDYGRDNELHRLTEFLEENELEYGYATFWYSQAITLISDSEVQVRSIVSQSGSQMPIEPYYYQSNRKWFEDQEGVTEYFMLLTNSEAAAMARNTEWSLFTEAHLTKTLEYEGFKIFVFDTNIFTSPIINGQ